MAEYGVVLTLITLAIVTSYALLAGSIQGIFELCGEGLFLIHVRARGGPMASGPPQGAEEHIR